MFGSVSFPFFRDVVFEDCIAFFADCIILRNDVDGKGMGWSWMISVRVQGMMLLPNKQYERMACCYP